MTNKPLSLTVRCYAAFVDGMMTLHQRYHDGHQALPNTPPGQYSEELATFIHEEGKRYVDERDIE